MIYITKRCPYCGSSYQNTTMSRNNKCLGNPFLKCSHCGREFYDKDCDEVETLSHKFQESLFLDVIIINITKKNSISIFDRKKYRSEAEKLLYMSGSIKSDEICESLLRTMNDDYCNKLESIGKHISKVDYSRFYYPSFSMTLNEFIKKHSSNKNKSENSSSFKTGYYLQ